MRHTSASMIRCYSSDASLTPTLQLGIQCAAEIGSHSQSFWLSTEPT